MAFTELAALQARHQVILDMVLAGQSTKEIAQHLQCATRTVALVRASQAFQSELSRRRADVEKEVAEQIASVPRRAMEELQLAAVQAAETQVALLDDPDPSIRARSAKDILDRTLGEKRDDANRPVVVINAERVTALQIALTESKEIPVV